ncbi:NADH:flavin oxidoreductase/NADH oxidase family protein [Mycobacteroides abscessus]|uniref:NADH:flavin oxidoreductase/NADH oxidase family protein n=1 Tax=Mycobacteroides abscessus TaxID=36809 RepID=UPI0009A57772|nr:NADH:flavin oxidoreductase/NADH oxidase family protein [Mycobacteroides abscessus]SKQ61527.1 Probable NADH:flavin oxidoreductase/NADH oxidase [Mycobacteroides abscessus subsp. massiliense]
MPDIHDPLPLANGQVLRNRLMKSALSEALGNAEQGPDHRLVQLFSRWGAGGYGLIVTGNVMVDHNHLGEPGNVVIEDDRHLEGLSRWAKATKDGGGLIWMQVNHPGRQANPLATKHQPVAPSAVRMSVPGWQAPRELTDVEIEDIIDRYARTAVVADTAGFDGVQIHGAHGYLVAQFLSPNTNRRTDRWGGDAQRRMRFVLEIVRRTKAAVSPGFAVAIKLNSADFQRGGFTEEESRGVIAALAAEGIDLIEISGGTYESPAMEGRPVVVSTSTQAREAYFLEYATTARAVAGDVPLAVTGGFRTTAAMNEAIASGACDVIGLGRPTTVNPEAAIELLSTRRDRLTVPDAALPLPARLAATARAKAFLSAHELQWHGTQMHRLGAGSDPDPSIGPWITALRLLKNNGVEAFRKRRSS